MEVSEGREAVLLSGRADFSPRGFRGGMLLLMGREDGRGVEEVPMGREADVGNDDRPCDWVCDVRWEACGRAVSDICCGGWFDVRFLWRTTST